MYGFVHMDFKCSVENFTLVLRDSEGIMIVAILIVGILIPTQRTIISRYFVQITRLLLKHVVNVSGPWRHWKALPNRGGKSQMLSPDPSGIN